MADYLYHTCSWVPIHRTGTWSILLRSSSNHTLVNWFFLISNKGDYLLDLAIYPFILIKFTAAHKSRRAVLRLPSRIVITITTICQISSTPSELPTNQLWATPSGSLNVVSLRTLLLLVFDTNYLPINRSIHFPATPPTFWPLIRIEIILSLATRNSKRRNSWILRRRRPRETGSFFYV